MAPVHLSVRELARNGSDVDRARSPKDGLVGRFLLKRTRQDASTIVVRSGSEARVLLLNRSDLQKQGERPHREVDQGRDLYIALTPESLVAELELEVRRVSTRATYGKVP